MSEPGFASLGPTLLARKGGAKPAMRPQVAPLAQEAIEPTALAEHQLEDLGWNDMGDSEPFTGAQIVPITADVGPIVRRQQRRLEARVLAEAALTGAEDQDGECDAVEPGAGGASETLRTVSAQSGRRAAFTLRLDAERHLKLRLASTMQGVSAQALLTDALDAMLAEFDDLDVIAKHLKRH